jgi:hypothetical protein
VTSHVHACGVTDIPLSRMHVPASGLFETPDRLIRAALFAESSASTQAHANHVQESQGHE